MSLFEELTVYHDSEERSAALNMALDEALLESACSSAIRFYRWGRAALSFGYFGSFADVAKEEAHRDLVRRWTGGGIVLHGKDLTYALVIPASDHAVVRSPASVYSEVHAAIRDVLRQNGTRAALLEIAMPKISEACFANPVPADVLVHGKKVAGAAQRRTGKGLLQQGSIQHSDLSDDFGKKVAWILSARVKEEELTPDLVFRAREIARQKYETRGWLERR